MKFYMHTNTRTWEIITACLPSLLNFSTCVHYCNSRRRSVKNSPIFQTCGSHAPLISHLYAYWIYDGMHTRYFAWITISGKGREIVKKFIEQIEQQVKRALPPTQLFRVRRLQILLYDI